MVIALGFLITIGLGDTEAAKVVIYNIYNTVWCGFAKRAETQPSQGER